MDTEKHTFGTGDRFAHQRRAAEVGGLRHDRSNPAYNPDFFQLIHVGFKVAAEMGPRYLQAVEEHGTIISHNVTENLFARHIKPIFV